MRGLWVSVSFLLLSLSGCFGLDDLDFNSVECGASLGSRFSHDMSSNVGDRHEVVIHVPAGTHSLRVETELKEGTAAAVALKDPTGKVVWSAQAKAADREHSTRVEDPAVGEWVAQIDRSGAAKTSIRVFC